MVKTRLRTLPSNTAEERQTELALAADHRSEAATFTADARAHDDAAFALRLTATSLIESAIRIERADRHLPPATAAP